ncbi:MAG: FumA C-terminus/TtdB family hydratase beta subunit [Nitrospirota bacterium]
MVEEAVSGQKSAVIIKTPLTKEDVLGLKIGDMVLISGKIVTGRDRVHKYLFNEKPKKDEIPFDLKGSILYHCGPIITKRSNKLKVTSDELLTQTLNTDTELRLIAGGPTTSIRVEMYEPWVIREYGIRGIIGKGGMGSKTLEAMRECGCVYLHSISGAAVYLADRVKRIIDGWKIEEFGMPEAMWLFEVEDFPAIVTMDAYGNSLHREIEKISMENLKILLG